MLKQFFQTPTLTHKTHKIFRKTKQNNFETVCASVIRDEEDGNNAKYITIKKNEFQFDLHKLKTCTSESAKKLKTKQQHENFGITSTFQCFI
jgi:hypothetical protein